MTGKALANKILEEFKTLDLHLLIDQLSIKIIYEKWHPTTYGEYDKKTKTLYINLDAPLPKEDIIAHELAHYFIHHYNIVLNRKEEEQAASEFAEILRG